MSKGIYTTLWCNSSPNAKKLLFKTKPVIEDTGKQALLYIVNDCRFVCPLLWVELCTLNIHTLKSPLPAPQDVTLYENKIVAGVISSFRMTSYWSRVSP